MKYLSLALLLSLACGAEAMKKYPPCIQKTVPDPALVALTVAAGGKIFCNNTTGKITIIFPPQYESFNDLQSGESKYLAYPNDTKMIYIHKTGSNTFVIKGEEMINLLGDGSPEGVQINTDGATGVWHNLPIKKVICLPKT